MTKTAPSSSLRAMLGASARRTLVLLALASPFVVSAEAQDAPVPAGPAMTRRPEMTRSELEALAGQAERQAATLAGDAKVRRLAEAEALRVRLRDGDFFSGDRVILTVEGGEKPFADTVVVSAGQTIGVEGLPDVSVKGVLRSELRAHLTKEFGRFIRTPVVQTRPLLRLTLQGGVASPGFYVVPTDAALTDVIMQAGGPVAEAELDKTVIRRAAQVAIPVNVLQDAMRRGLTVDQLGLHAGDVVDVPVKKKRDAQTITRMATLAVSVVGLVATLVSLRK